MDRPAPSYPQMFRTFGRIGLLSFGGPAAQISLMHSELVDRQKWLGENQFLGALSFCMLLPGPEAMQLATYAGWRLRGVPGGLLAGLLFVGPGALVILALALGYVYFGELPLVQTLFIGVKAAVVVIVLQALISLSRRALTTRLGWGLSGLSFVAMFFLSVPFPLIILTAALVGLLTARPCPQPEPAHSPVCVSWRGTLKTVGLWVCLWASPILLAVLLKATFLTDIALFFSKLAIVTFGGAYAVLAYMTQAVVNTHGWLSTSQMIDALGLAETTPGPLILVTEFVGLLAGFQQGGPGLAVIAGAMTLWVTFTPCFLWIFAGAPYVEYLLSKPKLKSALSAISAAVVGVILNLSVWFALHVLFLRVETGAFIPLPDPGSFSIQSAALIAFSAVLIFGLKLSLIRTLLSVSALSGLWHVIG